MRNIFRKQQVRQTDAEELDTLKKMVRWYESARILGDVSEEEYQEAMIYVDWRVSEMEKRL